MCVTVCALCHCLPSSSYEYLFAQFEPRINGYFWYKRLVRFIGRLTIVWCTRAMNSHENSVEIGVETAEKHGSSGSGSTAAVSQRNSPASIAVSAADDSGDDTNDTPVLSAQKERKSAQKSAHKRRKTSVNGSSNDSHVMRLQRPRTGKQKARRSRTLHLVEGPQLQQECVLLHIQEKYHGRWLLLTSYNPFNRDTIQHCNRYAPSAYECMNTDRSRVGLYEAAVTASCVGKVVMDIGTGPHALLAGIALRGGARKIHAVEIRHSDVEQAASCLQEIVHTQHGDEAPETAGRKKTPVLKRGRGCVYAKEPSFTVIHGHTSELIDTNDPDFEDALLETELIIHEIFDEIMSAEGVFTVIAKIQRRRMELHLSIPQSIPERAASLIAPIRLPVPDVDVHANPAILSPANKVLFQFHVPETCWLAHAQPFEEFDFNRPLDEQVEVIDGVPTISRTLTFRMRKAGLLVGFVLVLSIHLTAEVELRTTRDQNTSWRNPIVLLPQGHTHPPLKVAAGDVLELQTRVWLHDHRPDYEFTITNASNGIVKQNKHLNSLIGVTQQVLFEELNYVEARGDRIRSVESVVDYAGSVKSSYRV